MAVDEAKYTLLKNAGFSHQAALALADDSADEFGLESGGGGDGGSGSGLLLPSSAADVAGTFAQMLCVQTYQEENWSSGLDGASEDKWLPTVGNPAVVSKTADGERLKFPEAPGLYSVRVTASAGGIGPTEGVDPFTIHFSLADQEDTFGLPYTFNWPVATPEYNRVFASYPGMEVGGGVTGWSSHIPLVVGQSHVYLTLSLTKIA